MNYDEFDGDHIPVYLFAINDGINLNKIDNTVDWEMLDVAQIKKSKPKPKPKTKTLRKYIKTKSKSKKFSSKLRSIKTHLKNKSRPKILRKHTITNSKLKSKPRTKTLFGSRDRYQTIRLFAIYQSLNVDKISNTVDWDLLDTIFLEAIHSRTPSNEGDYYGYDNYFDVMADRINQITDKLESLVELMEEIDLENIKPKNFIKINDKIKTLYEDYGLFLKSYNYFKIPNNIVDLIEKWFLQTLDVMVFLMKYDIDVLRDLDDFITTLQNKTWRNGFDVKLLNKIEQFFIGLFVLEGNTKVDIIKNLIDFYEN